ncbi:hypothetical protein PFISCL1PPCAC_17432, partial [Pristionchus fissidentatus]
LSQFEMLPKEIHFQIIRFAAELINKLQLTSSQLDKSVREYRKLRGFRPAIKCIEFYAFSMEECRRMRMFFHESTYRLFNLDGVRLQEGNNSVYAEFENFQNDAKLLDTLKRESGLKLEELIIISNKLNMSLYDKLLGDVHIEELKIVSRYKIELK